jgi:hypothetical protein
VIRRQLSSEDLPCGFLETPSALFLPIEGD